MLNPPTAIFHPLRRYFTFRSPFGTGYSCGLLIAVYWLLAGCANPIAPEGGPRDTTPPKLDSLRSTVNFQTRFKKQTIVLAFDEWVELRDVFNQVVISPPLEKRPEIVRRKKTIQVIFDDNEVFRDSATYVINFGEAIRDLTEGNVAPAVFVFSTGDYIDSLSVEGNVVDAWTGKPIDNVLFMLYENMNDTVVRKERPFYFARTDKEGKFKVNNIKSGTFKAFALVDQNLNYRYDNDAEQIGFPDSVIVLSNRLTTGPDSVRLDSLLPDTLQPDPVLQDTLSPDSTALAVDSLRKLAIQTPKVSLRIFLEEKPLFLRAKDATGYGVAKLVFNREPYDAHITFDSVGQTVFFENEKDTIRLWYNLEKDTSWNIYVKRDTITDTVLVKGGLRANFQNTAKLVAAVSKQSGPPPAQPFSVPFSQPLAGFDVANIRLLEDSVKTVVQPRVRLDSVEKRNLFLYYNWKEGVPYELQLLPGCVTDIFGLVNADSTNRKFVAGLEKDYGTLTLRVRNLKPDTAYVIRLLDKDTPVKSFVVSAVDSFLTTLLHTAPSTYTVEIIEDTDRNGRWTTGNYDLRRQPERVYRKTLEQLRANWELEAEVDANLMGTVSAPAPAGTGPNRNPSGTAPPTNSVPGIRPGGDRGGTGGRGN